MQLWQGPHDFHVSVARASSVSDLVGEHARTAGRDDNSLLPRICSVAERVLGVGGDVANQEQLQLAPKRSNMIMMRMRMTVMKCVQQT